jgi:hypothetical protein
VDGELEMLHPAPAGGGGATTMCAARARPAARCS